MYELLASNMEGSRGSEEAALIHITRPPQAAQERTGGGSTRIPGIRRRCTRAALSRRGGGGGGGGRRGCCGPRSGVPLRLCGNNDRPHGARPASSVGWGTGGGGGGPRSGGSSCSPSGASA